MSRKSLESIELNKKRLQARRDALRHVARLFPLEYKKIYARKCVQQGIPVPLEIKP